jgi:hypothetical protein
MRTGESFHQAGHVATGIDDPLCALSLKVPDHFQQVFRDGWILEFCEQGSVEIGGEQFNWQIHWCSKRLPYCVVRVACRAIRRARVTDNACGE